MALGIFKAAGEGDEAFSEWLDRQQRTRVLKEKAVLRHYCTVTYAEAGSPPTQVSYSDESFEVHLGGHIIRGIN